MILTPGDLYCFQTRDKPSGNGRTNAIEKSAESIVPEPTHREGSNLLTEASLEVRQSTIHRKKAKALTDQLSEVEQPTPELATGRTGKLLVLGDVMLSRWKEQHALTLHLLDRIAEYGNLTGTCELRDSIGLPKQGLQSSTLRMKL